MKPLLYSVIENRFTEDGILLSSIVKESFPYNNEAIKAKNIYERENTYKNIVYNIQKKYV